VATEFASIPEAIEDIRQGKAHPLDLLFNFLGKLIIDRIKKKISVCESFIGNFLFVSNKKILLLVDLLMRKTR
jgi:hypothetical protein